MLDYHIVTDFSNFINYHHLNNFAKTLDSKNKRISIQIYYSLGTSSKQLTHFFDVQKNLSFTLENNNINTYIHVNDKEPIKSKPLSSPPIYKVMFSKFNKIDLSNQKNNYSASGLSSYMSNNSLFNFLLILIEIKSSTMLSSLIFSL
jgi:hypothetical protein